MNTTLHKSLEIIKQINALPLDETPVFTYDEAKKMESNAGNNGLFLGIILGFAIMLIFLVIADVITGGKVFVK